MVSTKVLTKLPPTNKYHNVTNFPHKKNKIKKKITLTQNQLDKKKKRKRDLPRIDIALITQNKPVKIKNKPKTYSNENTNHTLVKTKPPNPSLPTLTAPLLSSAV